MAVSGTSVFTVNRDDIIKASLRTLGVIGVGETPITEDYTNCSEALNIMLKAWAKKGFPLWVYQTYTIPMLVGLQVYPLGPTAGYIYSVDVTAGGTGYPNSGTVNFSSGAATGTYTASSGVIQSVTITAGGNSYITAPTVTFSGAGTGATGTANIAGLTVPLPLRIIECYIRNPQGYDTNMMEISRQEYDLLGYKRNLGIPNQYYYDLQLTVGNLYVYNEPSASGYNVYALGQRMFDDMTLSTDNFDFPQEWFQALKWGLCAELTEEYQVDENKIARIENKANFYINECFNWSQEDADVYFTMDYQGSRKVNG